MKKYFYFAAAAIVMVSACKKSDGFSQNSPLQMADDTKVAIEFGSNVSAKATKGAGSVDEWAEQNLYIFGYQRTTYTDATPADFSTTDEKICYIDGVRALAPAAGTEGRIDLYDRTVEAGWGYPFFYGYEDGKYSTYDFYACYIDDANAEVVADPDNFAAYVQKSEDQIAVPFVIDGTQDLMTAYADRAKDCEALDINPSYAYSGYSARPQNNQEKGVVPTLVFEHALAQFEFNVTNKSNVQLNLKKLEFDSFTTGDLVIAAKDVTEMGVANLDDSTALAINFVTAEAEDGMELAQDGEFSKCGSLIVTPEASTVEGKEFNHQLVLHVAQLVKKDKLDDNNNPTYDEDGNKIQEDVLMDMPQMPFAVTPAMVVKDQTQGIEAFEKGYRYVVNITIFSWEKIEIEVKLTEWKNGGVIDINPDDDPSFV